jgi:hypothetical protein
VGTRLATGQNGGFDGFDGNDCRRVHGFGALPTGQVHHQYRHHQYYRCLIGISPNFQASRFAAVGFQLSGVVELLEEHGVLAKLVDDLFGLAD